MSERERRTEHEKFSPRKKLFKKPKKTQVRRPPRNITYHEPVAQCHYCQKNPHAPECAEAVQAFAEYEAQGAAETAAKYGGAHAAHAHGGNAHGAGHH